MLCTYGNQVGLQTWSLDSGYTVQNAVIIYTVNLTKETINITLARSTQQTSNLHMVYPQV